MTHHNCGFSPYAVCAGGRIAPGLLYRAAPSRRPWEIARCVTPAAASALVLRILKSSRGSHAALCSDPDYAADLLFWRVSDKSRCPGLSGCSKMHFPSFSVAFPHRLSAPGARPAEAGRGSGQPSVWAMAITESCSSSATRSCSRRELSAQRLVALELLLAQHAVSEVLPATLRVQAR